MILHTSIKQSVSNCLLTFLEKQGYKRTLFTSKSINHLKMFFNQIFSCCSLLYRCGLGCRRFWLADVALHRLCDPVRHHAPHQHLPLLRHDLLLHQERDHREGAVPLWRLLHLWISVWVKICVCCCLTQKYLLNIHRNVLN